jgi:RHS repeat-associated protein
MDNAPWFDTPDRFDGRRLRLADIDGSGTTDILYLASSGVQIWFNQSGNGWSDKRVLRGFPPVENVSSVTVLDLLGNGTACLVWSSPLPGNASRPMRYIDLMGGQKPHLLVAVVNNLGAETHVSYAPSTRFYLADREAGRPWVTRLPFPVHVVERVETYDAISRTRFVTRYAYHHGYFDGVEREFRGFGMVEQWDTEAFAVLSAGGTLPEAANLDAASHVQPVVTRTWFHTGAYLERESISRHFEGDYYREPGLDDQAVEALLLPDTILPADLTPDEAREACRALKGMMLRQEVYAEDAPPGATAAEQQRASMPYTVVEQNFTIRPLQPQRAGNRHAIFFTHPCEAMTAHYERRLVPVLHDQIVDEATAAANPETQWRPDPRWQHAMTLEVDDYGNVLQAVAIGYGRRYDDADPLLTDDDRARQQATLITYTANAYTDVIDNGTAYRTPLLCEARTYELHADPNTGGYTPSGANGFLQASDFVEQVSGKLQLISSGVGEIPYEGTLTQDKTRRLIEHARTLYRKNDLTSSLPLGQSDSLALPYESYTLAFTPGLLKAVYVDSNKLAAGEVDGVLAAEGGYVHSAGDANCWIPSGQVFFHADLQATPAQESVFAAQHFWLPQRFRDPFQHDSFVRYDAYNLLVLETEDALQNTVTAGTRDSQGAVTNGNDYRLLQPALLTDPNGNQSTVAFDVLGLVAGTAVMGKNGEGDTLQGFVADVSQAQLEAFFADPRGQAAALLGKATTRILYDVERYLRSGDAAQPTFAATLARERHVSNLQPGEVSPVQVSLGYADGFGRAIQTKVQAEPGPVIAGGPVVTPRWVGSGWTIFNNKGKPVRQYEPFFSATHDFEFANTVGVSATLFYDPVGRVVATLHPNHTYEKVVFDPWRQVTWDVNDTVLQIDPALDADVGDFFRRLPDAAYRPTWYDQRIDGALGHNEQVAAQQTVAHADTPTVAWFDTLGRPFLTVAYNRVPRNNVMVDEKYPTRVDLDIEGNQRTVRDAVIQQGDALGRIVMRYDYDLLSHRIAQSSMEAGARWMLSDVAGKPIRTWDSRGHAFRTEYDALRRPVRAFVCGTDPQNADPRTLNQEVLFTRTDYGEDQPNATALNLRTRVFRQYDGAGIVTHQDQDPLTQQDQAYDFKGNLLRSTRQLVQDYKGLADWLGTPPLEPEVFHSATTYDALNRPVTLTTPDQSVIRSTYNEANLLERLDVTLRGAATPTAFVTNIDYNAKGQRELIQYGNGASTQYTYDPLTFRLMHLLTRRRTADFPDDCPQPPPAGWPGCQVQNLHYTYDPADNITQIRDDAQQRIYFRNTRVEPSADYTYDAIYRLIEATGREHLGQAGGPSIPYSYNDVPRCGLLHPNDGNALGRYLERYVYDAVGNFLEMQHRGSDPANPGWNRTCAYNEASLTEPGKQSNRLTSTTIGATTETYNVGGNGYDAQGNMLRMPHLQVMQWNFNDQLQMIHRQKVDEEDTDGVARHGERTWYVYDATGQRMRKVTERANNGGLKDECIYLGGFEIYRRHSGANAGLVRETLHIMDDKQRIALVETRNEVDDGTAKQLTRYQLGNHLGSASLELDDQAQLISYEEYTPYGSTAYQAVDKDIRAAAKRYRYTGQERDEETGFCYHGARYYACWLGRWTSTDPAGLSDGPNPYLYAKGKPTGRLDRSGTESEKTLDQNKSPSEQLQTSAPSDMSWDEVSKALFATANVEAAADKEAHDVENKKLREEVVKKAENYIGANWGRYTPLGDLLGLTVTPSGLGLEGGYQEEPDQAGTNDAKARRLMEEHPENFRRRKGTNFTTCVTLPPAVASDAGLRNMPWLDPISGSLRGALFVAVGQFVFANGTNKPEPGDVYLIGIRHVDSKGQVKWEFKHMGIVENTELGNENGTQKWNTIDGGQGISARGEHRVDRVERRYNPETGRITPEIFQNNPDKTVLIGWWNITELPKKRP